MACQLTLTNKSLRGIWYHSDPVHTIIKRFFELSSVQSHSSLPAFLLKKKPPSYWLTEKRCCTSSTFPPLHHLALFFHSALPTRNQPTSCLHHWRGSSNENKTVYFVYYCKLSKACLVAILNKQYQSLQQRGVAPWSVSLAVP